MGQCHGDCDSDTDCDVSLSVFLGLVMVVSLKNYSDYAIFTFYSGGLYVFKAMEEKQSRAAQELLSVDGTTVTILQLELWY